MSELGGAGTQASKRPLARAWLTDGPKSVFEQLRSRKRQIARALVLTFLLVGPAVTLEVWARNQVGLVPYLQHDYRHRLDGKKLLFKQIPCPKTVVLGTSMTEVALNASSIAPYQAQTGDHSFEPIFAFAAPGTRPIAMHGVWRWIQDQGCTPKYVFIEATPVILNIARGEDFERAFLDLPMQLDVSEDRFDREPYDYRFRADLATWWRSFAYRNREPIVRFLQKKYGKEKLATLKTIPKDGKLKATSTRELTGKFLRSQHRNNLPKFQKRKFKYEFSPSYSNAILALAKEARNDGAQAIIHTPPVPAMFHEFMDIIGANEPFCELYNKARSIPDVQWYSEYNRTDISGTEFSDWLHVNHVGAERYAKRILSAVASSNLPVDPYCESR